MIEPKIVPYPPEDEMRNFLLTQGWFLDRLAGTVELWKTADNEMHCSLKAAYTLANNAKQARLRKEEIAAGTAKIRCNKCSNMLAKFTKNEDGTEDCVGYYGIVNAFYKTGFWSENLPDGQRYIFSLCEECLAALFQTFKHEPDVEFEL
mgnify:CR=1 FL=1